jgi:ABC-2 type transport system permease protein
MRFSWRRARAVFGKDFLDLRKNRGLLFSMFALPAVLVIVPAGVVWAYSRNPDDPNLRVMATFYGATSTTTENAARFLIDKVLVDWFSLYLIMPVFVPILISSFAIAGEKERRTLEPLLASPVTGLELLVGKSLASLVPAFAVCVVAFAMLCLTVNVAALPLHAGLVLPTTMWMFGVFIISPLFAFFGNGIAVLISARVGDSRLAQQLSGMTVLPLVGLAAGQFGGFLKAGLEYYAAITAFVVLLDVVLLMVATRLFDRERLMSRWG